MPLIDVATAKVELRVTHDAEDEAIARKIAAAEEQATAFLARNVYEDQDALDAAKAAAPGAFQAATEAYSTDLNAARAVEDWTQRQLAERTVKDLYAVAMDDYVRTMRGMVVNDSIRTAILLITASLWEHRGDEDAVQGVPPAAERFLWPFRIGLGI